MENVGHSGQHGNWLESNSLCPIICISQGIWRGQVHLHSNRARSHILSIYCPPWPLFSLSGSLWVWHLLVSKPEAEWQIVCCHTQWWHESELFIFNTLDCESPIFIWKWSSESFSRRYRLLEGIRFVFSKKRKRCCKLTVI